MKRRSRWAWTVGGLAAAGAVAALAMTASGGAPWHFWFHVGTMKAPIDDEHAYDAPAGTAFHGWRVGEFGVDYRRGGAGCPPIMLSMIREPSAIRRLAMRLGLIREPEWLDARLLDTHLEDGWAEYVLVPMAPLAAGLGETTEAVGAWDEPDDPAGATIRWTLMPDGMLRRDPGLCRSGARWTRVDDVVYLDWFPSEIAQGWVQARSVDLRVLAADRRTWRSPEGTSGRRVP